MELGECSTSTPPPAKRLRGDAFDGVTPHASATSSAVRKKGPWDVFINHRGCDTKHKLASTIYHTLDLIGLRAFLDVEELELGDSLPQEIQEAMHTAGLHIAIFSKRYAQSPWCLAELSYMLQTGTPIIPVFYHVDPNDLRWVAQGKGCYAHAFFRHEIRDRYPSSKLKDWKTALQRVSNLSGHVLNSNTGDEGMLLKSIVNSVLRVLKKEPLEVAKHPVGMDKIVEDYEKSRGKCIQSEGHVQIVGIVGFGGSGKTTLATELYNRKSSSFHHSSCLYDVRYAASKNDLHSKQKKLLEDLRINTEKSFDNVREGKGILTDRLKGLGVLIVLDDVDHEDQLDALLPPTGSLGSGSLVIITTREGEVLTKWGITSIYKIKPLQDLHAKQLFCWHAFLQPFPLEGFEDLVEKYIDACKGLPLSLKVIGGQLYGKSSKDYWVCQLNKIQKILPKEILERLKVSYNALDEYEQEIFLDIACFCIGQEISRAISVWDASGWSGRCSWETLHNKCLVEDTPVYIRMHDHLRDLGRQIAKTRSPLRICHQSITFVKGITDTGDRRVGFQFHQGKENEFTEDCAELARGLLWLEWEFFKHTSIPSWLSLENIRILDIRFSENLETLWEDAKPPLQLRELVIERAPELKSLPRSIGRLKHLKILSLRHDDYGKLSSLSSLPEEFCELHSLEHLDLRGCAGLSSLPNCFGNLVNLRHLDLSRCESLQTLPESFKQLTHFEYLDLCGCNSLRSLENITNLKAIHFLEESGPTANQTSVGQLSLSFLAWYNTNLLPKICELSELKYLEIFWSEGLTTLPSLENLSSLTTLNLEFCRKLTTLPASLGNLSSLTTLNLGCCDELTMLPASLGNLSSLTTLNLNSCYTLTTLPTSLGNLSNLTTLNLETCEKLTMLPASLGNLSSLTTLNLDCCDELTTLPASLGNLSSLTTLTLKFCKELTMLPASLGNLSSLTTLKLDGCDKLTTLPTSLGNLSSLTTLNLKYCYELTTLPASLGNLSSLTTLNLEVCRELTMLPASLGNLSSLTTLNLDYCHELTTLPASLGNLSSLTSLNLGFCEQLTMLPASLGNLSSLTSLNLEFCKQLTMLPDSLGNLSSLTTLNLKFCKELITLPASLRNLSSLTTLELQYSKVEPLPIEIGQLYNLRTLKIVCCPDLNEPSLVGLVSFKKIEGLELFPSLEKLHLRTCRRCCFYGIHSLVAVERLQTVNLSADNITTFEACVQSIQIKSWPSEMTISGKVFPHFQSILDSFPFPGLVVVDSVVHPSDNVWSLTCQEANLSNAAVVCYLVQCKYNYPILINEVESSRVELGSRGEWIVISVFGEVSRLVEDGGGSLRASIKVVGRLSMLGEGHRVLGGRLMVGERDCIVESFKQLFQTLCNAAPISSSSPTS